MRPLWKTEGESRLVNEFAPLGPIFLCCDVERGRLWARVNLCADLGPTRVLRPDEPLHPPQPRPRP